MRLKSVTLFAIGLGLLLLTPSAIWADNPPADATWPAKGPGPADGRPLADRSGPSMAAPAMPTASPQTIARWIDRLGSESYSVRESASDHLVDAGQSAIDAVAAATQKDDLEVTTRSVQILARMLKSSDVKTADSAADALAKIAAVRNAAPAAMAAAGSATDALGDYEQIRQQRALSEISSLGGEVQIGDPFTGNPTDIVITLASNWRGTAANLKLFRHVPNLEHLAIHGLPITDRDLSNFNGLPQLATLELFGTKVTPTGSQDFSRAHPGMKVDRRGAKLGIRPLNGTCQIEMVEDGSAAKRADLRAGDVIVKFQGEAISDFETLTNRIGAASAGDKVTIGIDRGGQTIEKHVVLGDWK